MKKVNGGAIEWKKRGKTEREGEIIRFMLFVNSANSGLNLHWNIYASFRTFYCEINWPYNNRKLFSFSQGSLMKLHVRFQDQYFFATDLTFFLPFIWFPKIKENFFINLPAPQIRNDYFNKGASGGWGANLQRSLWYRYPVRVEYLLSQ